MVDLPDDPIASDEAYVEAIRAFATGRGDECRVVARPDEFHNWILGIETHDGHPLSITINYTP